MWLPWHLCCSQTGASFLAGVVFAVVLWVTAWKKQAEQLCPEDLLLTGNLGKDKPVPRLHPTPWLRTGAILVEVEASHHPVVSEPPDIRSWSTSKLNDLTLSQALQTGFVLLRYSPLLPEKHWNSLLLVCILNSSQSSPLCVTLTGHQTKGDSDVFSLNLQSWGLKQSPSGNVKTKIWERILLWKITLWLLSWLN